MTASAHIEAPRLGQIPVVSVARLDRPETVQKLGEALEATGFVALTEHGVNAELLQTAYARAEATFALPEADKRRYEVTADGRQRGYTSMGVEHAKDASVSDLKELWQVGRDAPGVPENVFPAEISDFEPVFMGLFSALDRVCERVLGALEGYLRLDAGTFAELTRGGNSVLRLLHYPPLAEDAPEAAVRAAAHEDINLITLLPVSTAPGLQILDRTGGWHDVETPPDVLICDTGDMMALFTEGRMPATTHRVVNPRGALARRSRYAMPFFCHPRADAVLVPAREASPALTAGQVLWTRLREIGLA